MFGLVTSSAIQIKSTLNYTANINFTRTMVENYLISNHTTSPYFHMYANQIIDDRRIGVESIYSYNNK